jgi:hypothetical protein
MGTVARFMHIKRRLAAALVEPESAAEKPRRKAVYVGAHGVVPAL